jgi:hypothetical protein
VEVTGDQTNFSNTLPSYKKNRMKGLFVILFLGISLAAYCQFQEGLNRSTINILTGQQKFDVNALIWMPPNYDRNKKYPLIIFGHGSAQAGTELDNLYSDGLPAVLKEGFTPPYDCIIICPQRNSYGVVPEWLPGILEDAGKRFSIDPARIYLTGTSAGGYMCYGSQLNVSGSLASKIAAICVLSGATQDVNRTNWEWWIKSRTPLWAIVGAEDQSYVHQNVFLMNALNQRIPGIAKISIRPGVGHGGWREVYNGSFRENGQTVWDWFYQFKLGSKPATSTKQNKRISLIEKDGQVYCSNVEAAYSPRPGDTLVIPTGIRSFLIRNFSGEKGKPIVIVPKDSGWLGGYIPYSANIANAKFFKVTGFHIDGQKATNFGMVIGAQTSDFEVANCHIRNTDAIGLCAKQNPDSSFAAGSWPGFSIRNVSLHDITVNNTGSEGFYIGYTFDVIKPLASPLVNLQIYNIRIDSTGWDGLQLSNCQEVKLHDIVISNYGLKKQHGQQAGLLLGGMVTVRDSIFNVTVSNGSGSGLLIFGRGLMRFNKIKLSKVGMSPGENAIYISDYKDFGYGLPPLQLDFKNIRVDGSYGSALVVANYNNSMKAGRIENLSFANTRSGILDDIDEQVNPGKKTLK